MVKENLNIVITLSGIIRFSGRHMCLSILNIWENLFKKLLLMPYSLLLYTMHHLHFSANNALSEFCPLTSSSFQWTKDGQEFDPGSDSELKVTEEEGSSAFYTLSNTMDTLKQYQGKYVCYASNELGTAVSNTAVLIIDGKHVQIDEVVGSH